MDTYQTKVRVKDAEGNCSVLRLVVRAANVTAARIKAHELAHAGGWTVDVTGCLARGVAPVEIES